jgi:hypothetical protein
MGDPRRARWLLLPLFFGSGFAALLYQMVWQRLLTLFGGADVYSVTSTGISPAWPSHERPPRRSS